MLENIEVKHLVNNVEFPNPISSKFYKSTYNWFSYLLLSMVYPAYKYNSTSTKEFNIQARTYRPNGTLIRSTVTPNTEKEDLALENDDNAALVAANLADVTTAINNARVEADQNKESNFEESEKFKSLKTCLDTNLELSKKFPLHPIRTIEGNFPKGSYHVLTFSGNAMIAEDVLGRSIQNFAKDSDSYVHVINLPGVLSDDSSKQISFSKGIMNNQSDLIKAAILQVEYLISKGVDPENIITIGFSLGGSIATNLTAHCHNQNKKISVFNDRSFSSISSVVRGHLIPKHYYTSLLVAASTLIYLNYSSSFFATFPTFNIAFSIIPNLYLLGAFTSISIVIKSALTLLNWDLNTVPSYKYIPNAYKQLAYADNDGVITNNGGLFNALDSGMNSIKRFGCFESRNPHFVSIHDLMDDNYNNICDNYIMFIKKVKFRNFIKDFVVNTIDDIMNANLPEDKAEQHFNNDFINKFRKLINYINHYHTNSGRDSTSDLHGDFHSIALKINRLITEYKINQNQSFLTKGLKSVWKTFMSSLCSVVSLVYNVNYDVNSQEYIESIEKLTDKIVDEALYQIINNVDDDGIANLHKLVQDDTNVKSSQNNITNLQESVKKFISKNEDFRNKAVHVFRNFSPSF